MKIRQILILVFLVISLLLGFVGYISKMTNSEINRFVLKVSEIPGEVQGAMNMALAVQDTQIALNEILVSQMEDTEVAKNIKTSRTQIINQKLEKIKQGFARIEQELSLAKTATELKIRIHKNSENLGQENKWQEESKLLRELSKKFSVYKADVSDFIDTYRQDKTQAISFLRHNSDQQYGTQLLSLIIKYENEREQEIVAQSGKVIEIINTADKQIAIGTLFTLITAIFAGSIILRFVLKPINKLKEAAEKISNGEFNTRIEIKSRDEVGVLANVFNQILDNLSEITIAKYYVDKIINSMIDTLIVINFEGNVVEINQAALQLLGYTENEVIGKQFIEIVVPKFYQLLEVNTLKGKGAIANTETVYLTKNGREIPVYFSASLMQDEQHKLQRIVCVARAITERKAAEKINTLLVTAVDCAADAIEITDAEARYEYVNPAFEKITGYKQSEVLGKTPASLLRSGEHDEDFYQKISNTLISGQVWSGCYLGKRKDGTLYHQEVTISPVSNEAGVITHHVAVKRDITERKQAEERLAKINECFLSFGTDSIENINRLTALFGELLGATCTLYNRLEQGMLCSVGKWQTPVEYNPMDKAEGNICYEIIKQGSDETLVLHNLPSTKYAQADPNITAYNLNTYIGKAVKCRQIVVGSLCAFYQTNYTPTEIDRKVIGIIAAAIGVEEERRATQESLRESEERYALAACAANDGLWDWNLKTDEMYLSSRLKLLIGYDENDLSNTSAEFFQRVHPQDIDAVKAAIAAHVEGLTPEFESEYRVLHKDGTYRWLLCRGFAARDIEGKPYRIAGSQTDITQRKQAESQLLHQAFHDPLTGLPNRLWFLERLECALERAKGENYLFAVLFLDLDRFKLVNDSLGHALGDQLLIAIARRLEACLRPGDKIARLGGDEFTILLEDIKDISNAIQVAERIQKQLSLPFNLNGHVVFTTASIGIALSTLSYDQPEELLRDADTTMYRAKALGRARSEIFDQTMHTQAIARLQLEIDLRWVLERQELRVYYQPIVLLKNATIAGFEALVRWQHPTRGLVSPAEFIPVAEETGLIIPMGWWILRQACHQMRSWQEQFPAKPPLTISVNISGKQFAQPDLVKQIEQILQETGLDGSSLKLEITESVLVDNAEAALAILKQLQALGIQLAIDDFGTGYSSLSYLHRLPIDTLKIDRSFVNNVDSDPEKIEIICTIIALAWNLGMNVVAEGVETKKQMYQLQALKCEFGQGYFFSKPVDSQMVEGLISALPKSDEGLRLTTL
jgi:diguanylate cyclase (GGDEF)-like protein/PAS domain S-box-containing protein